MVELRGESVLTARPASVCAGTKETGAGTVLTLWGCGWEWEDGEVISGGPLVLMTGDRAYLSMARERALPG
jgi:hypothetical protein